MVFGPLLAWKRGDLLGAGQRLSVGAFAAAVAIAGAFALAGSHSVLAPFGFGLAAFVIIGAFAEVAERTLLLRAPARIAFARALGLPRSVWGTALAHFGLGVMLLGIVGETQWSIERIASVKPGDHVAVRGYELTFDNSVTRTGPNYRELVTRFTVRRGAEVVGVLEPTKRTFSTRGTTTTEAALMTRGASQIYLSLGDVNTDGSVAVRLYFKRLVLLIWIGTIIMVAGGALSLSDRRLRVGAPKRSKARVTAQPAE